MVFSRNALTTVAAKTAGSWSAAKVFGLSAPTDPHLWAEAVLDVAQRLPRDNGLAFADAVCLDGALSNDHLLRLFGKSSKALREDVAFRALNAMEARWRETGDPNLAKAILGRRARRRTQFESVRHLKAPATPFTPIEGRVAYVLQASRPYITSGYATRGHGFAT